MTTNRNAMLARLELIASVLGIPDGEVTEAAENDWGDGGLIGFARRYGQSLDWIVMGDVRDMIASRAQR
jgi:hypothetical protein